nr:hypothetical protein [Tanacetum cinerariifolium]
MDSIIPLGKKNTLAEYMILSGADNHPPMLDKDLYDSWKSQMELYMQNKEHGRMILESVENGPLIWPTIEENGGRQGQSCSGNGYKSNATSSEGNNISEQARVVKCSNYQDPKVPDGQAIQIIILNNAAFQTEDLDTYDFNCDDISNAQAVLMANISIYGSDDISEVHHSETYLNDMENQSVHAMHDFKHTPAVVVSDNEIHSDINIIPYSQYLEETQQENEKANKEQNNESVTAELERYKERVKTFEQRLNIDLSSWEKMIDF